MSLLMFFHQDDDITVLTDTLATSTDGTPHMYVTKCWPIPHMGTLIAATGSGAILDRWVERVRTLTLARNVVNLDLHTPTGLRELWAEIQEEFSDHDLTDSTATVYHFGFDPDTQTTVRFVYRSTNNFDSERYDDTGMGIKPPPASLDFPEDLDVVALAEQIINEQAELAPEDRVYIGGDLYATTITRDGRVTIHHLHRFDDYADSWNTMCGIAADG